MPALNLVVCPLAPRHPSRKAEAASPPGTPRSVAAAAGGSAAVRGTPGSCPSCSVRDEPSVKWAETGGVFFYRAVALRGLGNDKEILPGI